PIVPAAMPGGFASSLPRLAPRQRREERRAGAVGSGGMTNLSASDQQWGIEPGYWDTEGVWHKTSAETRAVLLAAMGVDEATSAGRGGSRGDDGPDSRTGYIDPRRGHHDPGGSDAPAGPAARLPLPRCRRRTGPGLSHRRAGAVLLTGQAAHLGLGHAAL